MPDLKISFGGYQPPASVHTRAAQVFGEALRRALGDTVTFDVTGNVIEQGRKAADLLTMVESGDLSLCYFSTSYLADRVPEFALLDLPFIIDDRTKAYRILDGTLGALLKERLAAVSGFQVLSFWDNGFRHFSNREHPIRIPADCAGLRLRTLFSALHADVFRLLGFEPVALDVKDLLAAAADGSIDAQENPLTNTYNFGLHDHHPYVTLSSHFFGAAALLCNRRQLESWPQGVRDAVANAAATATEAQRRLAAEEDVTILEKLREAGTDIVALTRAERAAFVEAVAPLIERERAKFGDGLFRLVA
jgi:C4-dicarboxylate-binding protein DctP